jgi:hypothetical protein
LPGILLRVRLGTVCVRADAEESGRGCPLLQGGGVDLRNAARLSEEAIEAAFGCFVANEYGARDAGILAYECPQGGMHLTNENLILGEFAPGHP